MRNRYVDSRDKSMVLTFLRPSRRPGMDNLMHIRHYTNGLCSVALHTEIDDNGCTGYYLEEVGSRNEIAAIIKRVHETYLYR